MDENASHGKLVIVVLLGFVIGLGLGMAVLVHRGAQFPLTELTNLFELRMP